MASKRLRIQLSYDGTDFYGWQKQPNQSATLQGILENILSKIFNQKIAVVGSGRTDRGVHAFRQWAHFDVPEGRDLSQLHYKLQRMTPDSVNVKFVESAPKDFHAQISAISKCYIYRLFVRKNLNPFVDRFSLHQKKPMDLNYLQSASDIFLGEHDFTSFQSQGTPVSSPVREIKICRWVPKDNGFLEFQIQGNGFLKQMVRNIVGTLLVHHEKATDIQVLKDILNGRNRALAAAPAPAKGLFLSSVQYPQDLDNKCRKL